jgi:DNA repair protein RecO (recombination protein O)
VKIMDARAHGIVLRTHPLTETSLIVHWLTAEEGRLSTVAKGARRPASPFRGKLDLFYQCEFSFARSRRSELHTLREVFLNDTHAALRQELGWLRQATCGAALIEQNTETGTPLPRFFTLLESLLEFLPQQAPRPLTLFAFEMKLLAELGLQPDLEGARLTPGAKLVLARCLAAEFSELSPLRLGPAQAAEIEQFLRAAVSQHLAGIPRARAAALSVSA